MCSITESEKELLMETVFSYGTILMEKEPLFVSNQSFNHDVFNIICDIIYIQFSEFATEQELNSIVDESLKMFFICIYPTRSHESSYIVRKPNISEISITLDYLNSVPQPEQRTEEWFKIRHNYLTASNVWKAFSTESSRNQLIYSKCVPIDTSKYDRVNIESPMHWGQKYEDVSIEWYEREYKTTVSQFGCIPHSEVEFLAASPDGINTVKSSDRYGRMVEVKNIVNRDITGIPKTEYWIQMQLQLEVCNLEECDFVETRFTEYTDSDAFMNDGTFTTTFDGKTKGIMIQFLDTRGKPVYEYAPIGISESYFNEWTDIIMGKKIGCLWIKNIYWKLDEVSVVLVDRNKHWFNAAMFVLTDLWKTIEQERITGFSHRAPKKRTRATAEIDTAITRCLINLEDDT
jgi:putative phage-type endonuclease